MRWLFLSLSFVLFQGSFAQNLPSLLTGRNINARFSITAYDAGAQEWGIAVATNNIYVGNSTVYVQPGLGAFSVIAETEAAYPSSSYLHHLQDEALTSKGAGAMKDSTIGKVELYDHSAADLIDSNAKIEVIGRNYKWCEGPVWVPAKQMLLFSAVKENTIYSWTGKDTPIAYLTPSGYTDTAFRDGENGSNGLALDKEGRLLLCQSGNRQVVRMNASLDNPKPLFTVLAPNYKGRRFNSPNDLVVDSKDNIYFTDPIYGLPKRENDPTRELSFEGVYRIGSDGKLVLLIDSISRPNGIALSPDEKTLYVGSSDDKHTRWYAFHLDEQRNIQSGSVFFDGAALKEKATIKQGADGFKVDKHGNLFASGPDGINIISPAGKLLGLIKVYGRPASNCAFNETKDVLYITADELVLRVKLR